jgi:hypothetical protein
MPRSMKTQVSLEGTPCSGLIEQFGEYTESAAHSGHFEATLTICLVMARVKRNCKNWVMLE